MKTMRSCSIVIPTVNEEKNIPVLLNRIERVSTTHGIDVEIIFVDDQSTDCTRDVIRAYQGPLAIHLIVRENKRGLAGAVVTGAKAARNAFVVVMDADLSHPPEVIPELLRPLEQDTVDLVLGSRYVEGASLRHWPLGRKLASRLASLPARFLTGAKDPLAGFLAAKKKRFLHLDNGLPGFKIGFELLMSEAEGNRFQEIPIDFHDRSQGQSKMNGTVIKAYVSQLSRLCGLYIPSPLWLRAVLLGILAIVADLALLRVFMKSGFSVSTAHIISFLFVLHSSFFLLSWPDHHDGKPHGSPSFHLQSYGPVLAVMLAMLFLRGGFLATTLNSLPLSHPLVFIVQALSIGITWLLMLLALPANSILRYRSRQRRIWIMLAIGYSIVLRLAYLGAAELIEEEAYYWNYAQHLDYGYLDHPPMVAVLIRFGLVFFGDTELGVRLGALLCWLATAWFTWRYSKSLFGPERALETLLLLAVLPIFFGTGLLMTPDAPLVACWAASVYFLHRALVGGHQHAWIGAGISLGLGLVSKYTIALLGPAVLFYLVSEPHARKWFISPYPYLAAALALLIFSPVIIWNVEHGWASFLFQTHDRIIATTEFSLHELIASVIVLLSPVGVWALFFHLRPAQLVLLRKRWGITYGESTIHFILAMTLLPLSVFILFSLFKEVKLSWTGPIWIAVLPIISLGSLKNCLTATAQSLNTSKIWSATATILLLFYATCLHYFSLGLPGVPYPQDALLTGWSNLALQVTQKAHMLEQETGTPPIIVGMDKYRIASGLSFYQNRLSTPHGKEKKQILEQTTGRHLFGIDALMFGYWMAPERYRNRTLLVLSPDKKELIKERFRPYAAKIGELGVFHYDKFGKQTGPMYYRLLRGYRPARNEVALQ